MLKSEIFVPVSRRNMAYGLVIALFTILLVKLSYLMILQHESYRERADYNRIRPVTTYAPRGQILDRKGKVLASNRSVYTISIVSGELANEERELDLVAQYLGLTREYIEQSMKKYYRGRFLPARVAREIPIERLSYVEEHRNELPGVIYSEFPVRLYPNGDSVRASHLLGYLREISAAELAEPSASQYSLGDFIGHQGLEKQYEQRLKGSKGHFFQQVDALGREVGVINERAPVPAAPGEDILVTIDSDLQSYCEYLLDGKVGSAVILDAQTGEVLAMVSKPDYSLKDFAGFMKPDKWSEYLDDPARPLLNRAVLGHYPPGSAMKLITAVAGLEEGLVDRNWTIECTGTYHYGDREFGCWKPGGHGVVNVYKAIEESCNTYFYQLAQRMSINTWYRYARLFGFGKKTGIDLPEEYPGVVPDEDYMDEKYGKHNWTKGYLLNIAIGQGDVLVTPLQMARFMAIIAARGKYVQPRLISQPNLVDAEVEEKQLDMKKSTWDMIHQMTFNVVNAPNGTAFSSRLMDHPEIKFHGKTGTAENPHGAPHSWFIGFASKGDQVIALSVLVEHGGTGADAAAPIASSLVQHYFGSEEKVLTLK